MKRLIAVFLTALMVMALCIVFSSAEDVNLVKGLDGGVKGYEGDNKYTADLTDGKAEEKITFDNNWFGFYCNTDPSGAENPNTNAPGKVGTLVYNLSDNCTINKVRVHVALCNTSGIQSPKKITVSISEDGTNYTEFASKSYEIPEKDATDTAWEEFTGAARVGRYVKVTVELHTVFAFLNEVEVLGVKGGDPSTNPEPTSSDDTESSADTSSEADESKTESSKPADESKTESKTETSKTESSKTESVSSGEGEGTDMTWLWIVIAVVAVAAIVVLVVVSTKKKK